MTTVVTEITVITQQTLKTESYLHLVEQIQATVTEAIFNSKWSLVEGYWNVGKLIREEFKDVTTQLQGLAVDTKIGERTLWYALQAYDHYPQLDLVPEGKNISWTKLTQKYLPQRNNEVKVKRSYADLISMLKAIKGLLETEYLKSKQEAVECGIPIENDKTCLFIRYLQDQVNKITEGLEL